MYFYNKYIGCKNKYTMFQDGKIKQVLLSEKKIEDNDNRRLILDNNESESLGFIFFLLDNSFVNGQNCNIHNSTLLFKTTTGGSIFVIKNGHTDIIVKISKIERSFINVTKFPRKQYEIEYDFYKKIKLNPHQNIIRIYGFLDVNSKYVFADGINVTKRMTTDMINKRGNKYYAIIMERVDSDMFEALVKRNDIDKIIETFFCSDKMMFVIFVYLSCLFGIKKIHDIGFLHRDIKLENIGIFFSPYPVIKLLDFGLMKKKDDTKTIDTVGSHYYIPPEIFDEKYIASEKTDIYSLAITMVFIISYFFGINDEYVNCHVERRNYDNYTNTFINFLNTLNLYYNDEHTINFYKNIINLLLSNTSNDPNKRTSIDETLSIIHDTMPNNIKQKIIKLFKNDIIVNPKNYPVKFVE